jgi:tetratricopeptide (TPR) repeat protein
MQDLKGTLFWLILMMSNVVLVSFYTIPDIEPYYLPAMFAGFVLSVKMGYWLLKRGATMNLAHIITLPVALVLMASLLIVNYHKIDHSDYTLSQDYGRLILNSAGEGTVFTGDDLSSFPVLYLRYAEGYAPQVEAYDKASRLKALMDKAQSLLSLPVSDYYSARRVYIEKSPGVKHIVKSHHIYDQQWLDSPVRLYSNGLLFSTQPPLKKISWEQIHPPSYVEDFKVRQLLVNIELCKGKELLLSQPRDSISAVHYFLNAFEILKDEPRAALHNQLGIYFRRWGYADLALKSYDRALKSPRLSKSEREDIIFNISNVHKDIGNSCVSRGDFSGAVEAYEKALEYDPQNPKILYNLGLIYCQYLQSPGKALPYLEAYIKLKPEDQQVLNLLHAIRSQISPTVINK